VRLARPALGAASGGAVVVLDYESHRDEALREQQADLWLGFQPDELAGMAARAGLVGVERGRVPRPWRGEGPDSHPALQWLAGRRGALDPSAAARPRHTTRTKT